jgi:hypothetical protein
VCSPKNKFSLQPDPKNEISISVSMTPHSDCATAGTKGPIPIYALQSKRGSEANERGENNEKQWDKADLKVPDCPSRRINRNGHFSVRGCARLR